MTQIDSTYYSEDLDLDFKIKITFEYYPGQAASYMEPEEPETLEIEGVLILLAVSDTKAKYVDLAAWGSGLLDESTLEEKCWQWLKLQEEAREAAIEDYHEDRRRAMH